jgi:predicted kinase
VSDETFFDVLRSDCAGRISDDHETKLAAVEEWINEFQSIDIEGLELDTLQTMYILIGASGSGKSTWIRKMIDKLNGYPTMTISQDEQKEVFFKLSFPDAGPCKNAVEQYDAAWHYCTMAPESSTAYRKFFEAYVKETMGKAKASKAHVFIDIVNASKKKRQMWVDQAKRFGLRVVAVEFWNAFDVPVDRQTTRDDKCVPYSSIKQQVNATSCAWIGQEAEYVILEIGPTANVTI